MLVMAMMFVMGMTMVYMTFVALQLQTLREPCSCRECIPPREGLHITPMSLPQLAALEDPLLEEFHKANLFTPEELLLNTPQWENP